MSSIIIKAEIQATVNQLRDKGARNIIMIRKLREVADEMEQEITNNGN